MHASRIRLLAFAATGTALVAIVGPAAARPPAATPTFAKPVMLPKYDGGEPSLGIDPNGDGGVYVTAPQGLGGGIGVGFWASRDHGKTWPTSLLIGSSVGGGDSDVVVGRDHTVYIADLEAAANAICRSTDRGKSFVDATSGQACNGVVTSQYGLISDREWLTVGPDDSLYLTYHDLHVELPYTLRSTDKGRTFTPCGPQSFAATGDELKHFTPGPTSGTQVPRPAIGKEGELYTMFATGDPTGSGFDHLYLTTTPGCSPASVWTSYPIYAGTGADLAQPFDGLAIDAGGTLYVVASGNLNTGDRGTNVWLFRSDDGGKHWTKPIRVNTPNLRANMLPAITGGLRGGQVAIGWYGSSTGENNADGDNEWRYYVATSTDGGKHFVQGVASPVLHEGNQARHLLDFTSVMVEPKTGAVMAAFGGDIAGPLRAYFVRQTGGRYLR